MGIKMTEREKDIFCLWLGAVLLFVSVRWLGHPLKEKNQALDRILDAHTATIQKYRRQHKAALEAHSRYEAVTGIFGQKAPDAEVMAAFLSNIEQASRQLGLRLSELKPETVQEGPYLNRFSASLTLESRFSDVMRLLTILQSAPFYCDVEEIRMEPVSVRGTREGQGRITTRVKLTQVFLKT